MSITDNEISGFTRIKWAVLIVLQQIVGILIGKIISRIFNADLDDLWIWHEVLAPLGVGLIMFEGILAFSPLNHLTGGLSKKSVSNIHGGIMGIGLTLMTIGVSFAYASVDEHFASTHAIFGLVAWILFLITTIGGIFLAYLSQNFREQIKPIYIRFVHTTLGLTSFITALTTLALGLGDSYNWVDIETPLIITIIVIIGTVIFLQTFRTIYNHAKTILTNT